jgi:hypothetical protein
MRNRIAGALLTVAATLVASYLIQIPASSQEPPTAKQGKKGAPIPPGPTPRLSSGRVDMRGLWRPNDIYLIEDISLGMKEPVPLNAAGKALMNKHQSKDDPEANCLPTGVPRHAPYPWKIVEEAPYMYFLFEGNIHSFRQIFMDGRKHPADPNPTWYGHSVGRWDGDTLVVDTVGFNDRFWFDFVGHPHSEQLHTVERYTRSSLGLLNEEIVVEDPGVYSKPFTITSTHRLLPGDELMEYICQENQRDTQHLVGPAGRP